MTEIDVVILTWNDGPLLGAAVRSTLASLGVTVRVVVVDNGSSPRAVIPSDSRVTLVRNEENRGVAPGRNQGVACGDADLVCLLDSDATVESNSLATLATVFSDPKIALAVPVFSGQAPHATAGKAPTASVKIARALGRRADYDPSGPASINGAWQVDFGIGACQMFRRSVFREVGGLDDSIFYGPEDVDFCLRIRDAGYQVVQVAGSNVTHPPRRANRKAFTRAGMKHGYQVGRYLVRRQLVTGLPAARAGQRAGIFRVKVMSAVRSGILAAIDMLILMPTGRLIGRLFRDRIPFSGELISTASQAIPTNTKARILFGRYKRDELRLIRRWMRTDLDVVELGSRIGVIGLAVRQRLGSDRTLICVESNPELLDVLRLNVRGRGGGCRVIIEHGATIFGRSADVIGPYSGAAIRGIQGGSARAVDDLEVSVPAINLVNLLDQYQVRDHVLVLDLDECELNRSYMDPDLLNRCQQLFISCVDGIAIAPELEMMLEDLDFTVQAGWKQTKVYRRH